jgi:hypothetical protein
MGASVCEQAGGTMKKTDRFLIGITSFIVVLTSIALIVVLRRPAPEYLFDQSPGSIAHNYLLALQRQDYERAYRCLSPTLKNYPPDLPTFKNNLTIYNWRFSFSADEVLSIAATEINGDEATVTVQVTRFEQRGPFESGTETEQFTMSLQREPSGWKLWRAERYWAPCWNSERPCR